MPAQEDAPTEPVAASEATTQSPKPEETETASNQKSASPAPSSPASSVTSPTSTERDAADAPSPNGAEQAQEPNPSSSSTAPPLPSEPVPGQQPTTTSAPPLPSEPAPGAAAEPQDDGWEYHWNASTSSYWFYNRHTQVWQENNPRITTYPSAAPGTTPAPVAAARGQPISDPGSISGGYNPAVHGDYDPNAWYARAARAAEEDPAAAAIPGVAVGDGDPYATAGLFNRATGAWQLPEQGPERHGDEAKSKRQLNNFFDVDAAANEHDGRSLKAERAGKKPTKQELKVYKEKRRARKEEKRRAWLRD